MCSNVLKIDDVGLKLLKKLLLSLDEKKAERVTVLSGTDNLLVDCFVICEGTSRPHIKTLANHARVSMKEAGYNLHHWEGYPASDWMLLDFGQVILHIFEPRTRERYGLETLWTQVELPDANSGDSDDEGGQG